MITLQTSRHLDADIARAAGTLADHAFLVLAAGIVIVVFAMGTIVAAARLAGRYRTPVLAYAPRVLAQVKRVPVVGPVLAGTRVVLPTRYVALHLILGLIATAAIMTFIIEAGRKSRSASRCARTWCELRSTAR